MTRWKKTVATLADHEETNIRKVLYACEAVACGNEKVLVVYRDRDVLEVLTYFLGKKVEQLKVAAASASTFMNMLDDVLHKLKGVMRWHDETEY